MQLSSSRKYSDLLLLGIFLTALSFLLLFLLVSDVFFFSQNISMLTSLENRWLICMYLAQKSVVCPFITLFPC